MRVCCIRSVITGLIAVVKPIALQTFLSCSLRPQIYGVQRVFDDSSLGAGGGAGAGRHARVNQKAIGLKTFLQVPNLRLPGCVGADLEGSVMHAVPQ